MASAKQIAWRKKFARMSKAGKFRKAKKRKQPNVGSHYVETQTRKEIRKDTIIPTKASRIRTAKGYQDFDKHWMKKMSQDQKTAEIEKDVRQHMKWKDAKRKYGYGTIDLLQFYFAVSPRMAKTLGLPKTPPKYGQSPA